MTIGELIQYLKENYDSDEEVYIPSENGWISLEPKMIGRGFRNIEGCFIDNE